MGNHDAGRAMGRMADLALKMRTNQTALEILDQICEPYRGCDAEFEAVDPANPHRTHPEYFRYTDPNGTLGRLIQEAFDPKTDWIRLLREAAESHDDDRMEAFWNSWGEGPEKEFDTRYEFC